MNRPKLISYSLASVDGRLTLGPDVLLLFGDPRWEAAAGSSDGVYAWLQTQYQPQAFLEGSGSLAMPGVEPEPLPAVTGDAAALYQDFLPAAVVDVPGRRWMTVVDGRGRVRWMYKEFPGEEWTGWHVLVLVSHTTPAGYLAYLQRENIPYLVAGRERVDLAAALDKLTGLGVTSVVSTAGGKLSGALLRQGLVDEIMVEVFPAVIGGEHTPSLFTAPDLAPGEQPARLELLGAEVQPDQHLRLSYRVCRTEGAA